MQMEHQISWYIEHRVIYTQFINQLSLEQLESMARKAYDFLEQGEGQVHMIVDIGRLRSFPTNLIQVKKYSDIYTQHPKLSFMIFVGIENQAARFLTSAVMQLAGLNYQILTPNESLEAALKRIEPNLFQNNA
ncbi:MAG: hypothetical protein MUF87_11100 [Anaerolineae bacterium]|jgi:hypothetical protein|nr:hypothetical protein [Anaerolineae bacterium]